MLMPDKALNFKAIGLVTVIVNRPIIIILISADFGCWRTE